MFSFDAMYAGHWINSAVGWFGIFLELSQNFYKQNTSSLTSNESK